MGFSADYGPEATLPCIPSSLVTMPLPTNMTGANEMRRVLEAMYDFLQGFKAGWRGGPISTWYLSRFVNCDSWNFRHWFWTGVRWARLLNGTGDFRKR